MEEVEYKKCKKCGFMLRGRSDKIFCSYSCRNNFNNDLSKEKIKIRYKENKKVLIDSYRSSKEMNREKYMLVIARAGAKKRGIYFNLTAEDIIIPTHCPVLGIELKKTLGREDCTPSLDRIDNDLGYVKDNVWVISFKANRCKSDLNKEELLLFCANMLNKIS